jgi:YD repeat-containing protein
MKIVAELGKATFVAGDGARHVFNQSGAIYTAPVGFYRRLVKNADNTWQLTNLHSDKYYKFLADGRLDSVRRVIDGAVVAQCTYNGQGQLTQVQSGGSSIGFSYSNSRISTITDTFGSVHTLIYASGRLTEHRLPALGGVVKKTVFAYDTSGIVKQVTDPALKTWNYTFDSSGSLTGTSAPDGATYTFGAALASPTLPGASASETPASSAESGSTVSGWPQDVTASGQSSGPSGAVHYGFDSLGRIVAYQGANGDRCVYSYDSQNNRTGKLLASGGSWSWAYDANGRLISETEPDSLQVGYTRDIDGRVLTVNRGGVAVLSYAHDSQGRLTTASAANGPAVDFGYGADGNLSSITVDGVARDIEFNSSGKLVAVENLSGVSHQYSWNGSLLQQETDARGRVSQYQRDGWGRITQVAFPTTGNTTESWQYDSLGFVISAVTGAGSYSFARNDSGLITSVTGPEGTTSAAYVGGRVSYVQDIAGRRHSYTWNSEGCVSKVLANDGTGAVDYTYNANNQIATCTYPNDVKTTYDYDGSARLNVVTHRKVSTNALIRSHTAVFGSGNRIAQVTEQPTGDVTTFQYDTGGRLVSEERTGALSYRSEYTYTADGMPLTIKRWENGAQSANILCQYTSHGLLQSVSDSIPNLTEHYSWYSDRTLQSFTGPGYLRLLEYDEHRRLTKISKQVGSGAPITLYTYSYDLDDAIASFVDHTSGQITRFALGVSLLSGDLLIVSQKPTSGGSWTEVARYFHGLDQIVKVNGSFFLNGLTAGPVAVGSTGAITGLCSIDSCGILRQGSGVLASAAQLPGRVVHEGITISIPSGGASILERALRIS